MIKLQLLLIVLTTVFTQFTTAQEKITPPSKGKAVVYFVRTSAAGSLYNFSYFAGETYLGKFNGRKAFRYECNPGKHIFWVKSGNIDFIEAEVKEGAIYLIEVKATVDLSITGVELHTVDTYDKKQMKRIHKIFKKKKLIDLNAYEVTGETEKIYESQEIVETEKRIKRNLKKIEKKKAKGGKVKKITPDMNYIPQ